MAGEKKIFCRPAQAFICLYLTVTKRSWGWEKREPKKAATLCSLRPHESIDLRFFSNSFIFLLDYFNTCSIQTTHSAAIWKKYDRWSVKYALVHTLKFLYWSKCERHIQQGRAYPHTRAHTYSKYLRHLQLPYIVFIFWMTKEAL